MATKIFPNDRIFWNYVLPFLLIMVVLLAWEYAKPRYPVSSDPVETRKDTPQTYIHAQLFKEARNETRASTLRALDQPWSSFCTEAGHKKLIAAISGYIGKRFQEEIGYTDMWGDAGRSYIRSEFSSADDRRIERLLRDVVQRGYADPKEFLPFIAERLTTLVGKIPVSTHPC